MEQFSQGGKPQGNQKNQGGGDQGGSQGGQGFPRPGDVRRLN